MAVTRWRGDKRRGAERSRELKPHKQCAVSSVDAAIGSRSNEPLRGDTESRGEERSGHKTNTTNATQQTRVERQRTMEKRRSGQQSRAEQCCAVRRGEEWRGVEAVEAEQSRPHALYCTVQLQ